MLISLSVKFNQSLEHRFHILDKVAAFVRHLTSVKQLLFNALVEDVLCLFISQKHCSVRLKLRTIYSQVRKIAIIIASEEAHVMGIFNDTRMRNPCFTSVFQMEYIVTGYSFL